MSKKDIGSKLAAGIRQVKQLAAEPASVTTPAHQGEGRGASKPSADPLLPANTTDRPWQNLHPDRVWPD